MSVLQRATASLLAVVHGLEEAAALDRVAEPLGVAVSRAVAPLPLRNALSGADVGHPVHPVLTDLPIGAWTMATMFDALRLDDAAADVLVAAGILLAVPTAATGLNDWSDTYGAPRRVGLVHAAANSVALALYTASLLARRRGARSRGRLLGYAGMAAVSVGGYLGGHLTYAEGVNVNHTAFEERPEEWTDVGAETDLAEGPNVVTAGSARVLVVREGARLRALADTCSHAGGPLHEGEVRDGCVICPWHGSTFRLDDGSIVRGPASTPQPLYDARVVAGRVEVRATS